MVLFVLHALEATLATRFTWLDLLAQVRLFYPADVRVYQLVQMRQFLPLLWRLAVPLSGELWSPKLGMHL